MSDQVAADILGLTAQIVSAHISKNSTEASALPALIQSVYRSLSAAGDGSGTEGPEAARSPAVPIKKSVFPDYLVSLESGKKLKMLKRYLQTSYGMTPDAYRAKWGLPASYPMVAPNYAAKRSSLAKSLGLGRKPGRAPPGEPEVLQVPARRARGSKG